MNKTKLILDTSFISSLLNSHDINNDLAIKIYTSKVQNNLIIIPFIVSIELLATNQHENLIKIIEYLNKFSNKIKYPDERTTKKFIRFIERNKLILKSNDLFILFTTFEEKAELITFDQKLNKEYKKLINKSSKIQA